jgi:hypothetical protein
VGAWAGVVAPDVVVAMVAGTVVVGAPAVVVATSVVALGTALLISVAVVAGVSGSELPPHAENKRTRITAHMFMVTFEVIK